MLLVITALAISGVREATLEARITANKAHALHLVNASEAALREAEFRYFNAIGLREKLEPREENCSLDNELKANGANKPCLLPIKSDKAVLKRFVVAPLELNDATREEFLSSWDADALVWMPYRGRDHAEETEAEHDAEWNTYLISGGPGDDTPMNVEYGAFGEGKGTFYYLANGQASDEADAVRAAQSTFANVYVGLNN
jgi:type IV pilus assembly protein PilX